MRAGQRGIQVRKAAPGAAPSRADSVWASLPTTTTWDPELCEGSIAHPVLNMSETGAAGEVPLDLILWCLQHWPSAGRISMCAGGASP